jgi:hypothetical protein
MLIAEFANTIDFIIPVAPEAIPLNPVTIAVAPDAIIGNAIDNDILTYKNFSPKDRSVLFKVTNACCNEENPIVKLLTP